MVNSREASKGSLVLIPCFLGENAPMETLPEQTRLVVSRLSAFIVENEKSARRFIKIICPEKSQQDIQITAIDKHKGTFSVSFLDRCLQGESVGLLSEAGCPGVADPGAEVVLAAHHRGIRVQPLIGASSILLALMASGMNGQKFAFHGYLPIDKVQRKKTLKNIENESRQNQQTQLFIETPYRNKSIFQDMLSTLSDKTLLCLAFDLTLPTESIKTMPIKQWRTANPHFEKRPCIFLIYSGIC